MVTKEPVPLLYNPVAGRGRAAKRIAGVSALLSENGVANTPVPSRAPGDLTELAASSIEDGHRRLIVAGGDGSIHEVINGVMQVSDVVELGVIPIGTGNDFAKASSIPLHWEHATALLADRMSSDAPAITIDLGRCNDLYFANGCGIGFDAQVADIAEGIRWRIGDLVYLAALMKLLYKGIATPDIEVRFGGHVLSGSVTLVSLCNGPWVGGSFHIAPGAYNNDGLLDIVYAEPVTRRRILGLLPKLLKGTHVDASEVKLFATRSCEVTSQEPVIWQLDGEVQKPRTDFDIEVLPGALRLL